MTFGVMSWALLLAAVAALLIGVDFERLAALRVRAWWLIVLALAFKVALLALHVPPLPWAQPLIFLLVAVGAVLNWRLPGMSLIALGLTLNAAVVAANAGLMPYSPTAFATAGRPVTNDATTALAGREDSSTRLLWLDDRLPVAPTHQVVSTGDVAILAGGVWLVLGVSTKARSRRPRAFVEPL